MSSSAPPPRPPTLSSAQVRAADAAAVRRGVEVDWLMEAAGWQAARACIGLTAVVCGTGNNGGDGLAAARHLHRWGRLHSVACLDGSRLAGLPAARARALELAGVAIHDGPDLAGAETVLDAIFGVGLNRPVTGSAADWIEAVNTAGADVLAVDVPSGLDADTGEILGSAVRARRTLTFGLAKPGLLRGAGPACAGEVWVADIGLPLAAYAEAGVDARPGLPPGAEPVRIA